jgi:catechol 2,3-dioxygenase-like lactoylglutathione lyase family enzyme
MSCESAILLEAAMPTFLRALHLALTVRDMRVSAKWYDRVLGFDFVREFRVAPGDSGIPRILLLHQRSGFLLGLCEHRDRTGDSFDPLRTGLDHLALEVADRSELDSWMTHLDQLGVAHSPVRELGHSCFVSLQDPDGIQIELWLTITPHRPAARR